VVLLVLQSFFPLQNSHNRNVHPLPTADTSKEDKGMLNVNLATGRNLQSANINFHTACSVVSSDNTHVAATCNSEISAFFCQEM